jgi:hypothetical protein
MLADWIEGKLGPGEAKYVEEAVAADLSAQRAVDWLQRFVTVADTFPLHTPPPVVRQRLNQLFLERRVGRPPRDRQMAQWPAELQYDSRQDRELAGVRGATIRQRTAHLAYVCDVADVVLDLIPTGRGTTTINGQVLLATGEGGPPIFTATAYGSSSQFRTIEGDDLGRFHLPDVPLDVDRMMVENGELTITFPLKVSGVS